MIKVLLIEDKKSIRDEFIEFIESKHLSDFKIESCDFAEFDEMVSNNDFDIIITDYKDDNGDSDAGLIIVNKIKETTFLPILVYSGNDDSFIDPSITSSKTPFLQYLKKDGTFPEALDDKIISIIDSNEFKVKQGVQKKLKDSIDKNFKEYFWNIMQNHWDDFKELDPTVLERILSRKIIKDLHPQLLSNEKINAIEFYEHPVVDSKKIENGSILKKDDNYFLCINNDCDLSIRGTSCNASRLILMKIKDASELNISGGNKNQLINNNHSKHRDNKFICPKAFFFQGGYVDFDDITTRNIEIEEGKIKLDDIGGIIAKIHSPFIHRLVSNFARYYNRFGTPDINL